jgi:hypothetical protein
VKATEVIEMKIIGHFGLAKIRVSDCVKTRFPLKLVSGVALGALFLTAVVGFPFDSTDAVDSADSAAGADVNDPSNVQHQVEHQTLGYQDVPKSQGAATVPPMKTISRDGVTEFFGEDVVAALGHEVLIARLGQYGAYGQLSSRDMERLDQEIDMLMRAAANESSEARAAYSREMKRLEQKIATMLSEAKSKPTGNLVGLDRKIQRLDERIETLRQAATQHQ